MYPFFILSKLPWSSTPDRTLQWTTLPNFLRHTVILQTSKTTDHPTENSMEWGPGIMSSSPKTNHAGLEGKDGTSHPLFLHPLHGRWTLLRGTFLSPKSLSSSPEWKLSKFFRYLKISRVPFVTLWSTPSPSGLVILLLWYPPVWSPPLCNSFTNFYSLYHSSDLSIWPDVLKVS